MLILSVSLLNNAFEKIQTISKLTIFGSWFFLKSCQLKVSRGFSQIQNNKLHSCLQPRPPDTFLTRSRRRLISAKFLWFLRLWILVSITACLFFIFFKSSWKATAGPARHIFLTYIHPCSASPPLPSALLSMRAGGTSSSCDHETIPHTSIWITAYKRKKKWKTSLARSKTNVSFMTVCPNFQTWPRVFWWISGSLLSVVSPKVRISAKGMYHVSGGLWLLLGNVYLRHWSVLLLYD